MTEKAVAAEPCHLLDTDVETGIWALGITEKSISTTAFSSGELECESFDQCDRDDDIEKSDATAVPKQFDFIHIRYRNPGLPDRPRIFRTAFEQTKPGGWIEVVENRLRFVGGASSECMKGTYDVTGSMMTAAATRDFASWIRHQLLAAGFVDVEEKVWSVSAAPGPWQRIWGGVRAVCKLLSPWLAWNEEKSYRCRTGSPSVFVIARKPW